MQPQGHLQTILRFIHNRSSEPSAHKCPQHILDSPRFCIALGTTSPATVFMEPNLPDSILQALRCRGHDIEIKSGPERSWMGRGQMIHRFLDSRTGVAVLCGGSGV
jgi:gamma-glutamyltranspeptidase